MRYTGPKWKRARRLGYSLLGTQEEFNSHTLKKHEKRTYAPGQHGAAKKKQSEYGKQLTEKQKLRDLYGINERQFRRLFLLARKGNGVTGTVFMTILESRLDNLVYRMGFASTRRAARQLVTHGHVLVNGQKCDIPSLIVNVGDEISIKEKSQKLPVVKANESEPLKFVTVDKAKLSGKYTRFPERSELNQEVNETNVVE